MSQFVEGSTPQFDDAYIDVLCENLPQITYKAVLDQDEQFRIGHTFILIDLLKHLRIHSTWGIMFPTLEELGALQEKPINYIDGPTEFIEFIHEQIQRAVFDSAGMADWRVLHMLRVAGYPVLRYVSKVEDDTFTIRHIRGDIVFYAPEGVC